MAEYEIVLVVDPRMSDEEFETLSGDFKVLLGGQGAELVREESWGKRKLAYPIQKQTEGRYHIYEFETGEPLAISEVEQRLRQNESILRYLTVRTDKGRLRRRAGAEPTDEAGEGATEESVAKEDA